MKILLLTPLYPEINRPDLKKDTEAIHYFTREWVKDGYEVVVIHIYLNPIKKVLHHRTRKKVFSSTNEGVKVLLFERQLLYPHARRLLNPQQKLTAKSINEYFSKNIPTFTPDILITHFPTYLTGVIEGIDLMCPKFAVLHHSDVRTLQKINNSQKTNKIFEIYSGIGFRAPHIQSIYNKYVFNDKPNFMVRSGIPAKFIPRRHVIENKKREVVLKILYAGNLVTLKNVDITIKALHKISDSINFKFTIIGDGPQMNSLKRLVSDFDMEDKIVFTGRLNREETLTKMNASDIFIMASSPETFGLVYLEAMSQGCIVIGSRGEGIDGIINDGENGFLVQPGNIEELANKLINIKKLSQEVQGRICINAYNTVVTMTDEEVAKEYILNIQNIININ